MVDLAPALLAGILATQVAQLGFDARLLSNQSSIRSKVKAMWADYQHRRVDK